MITTTTRTWTRTKRRNVRPVGRSRPASDGDGGPRARPSGGVPEDGAREMAASLAAFRRAYPAFARTDHVDALRVREYARLDAQGHTYLDYTGGGLYAASQVRAHRDLLERAVFGNPHSHNPTSQAMTALVEQARSAVLTHFNAAPDEYVAIFTPNASGALKLVGEAYPFAPGGQFVLSVDNHNSVNGIREFARARGSSITYLPLTSPDLRVDEAALRAALDRTSPRGPRGPRLFAFPAQSNFSGAQHPLAWIAQAQARGWTVLLDGAAFAPTNRLDLGRYHPDFVALSFYKMFGYPTGVGCLLARRAALARLRRPWFAGGTVWAASVGGDGHLPAEGADAFEDGTVDYLALPAVTIGLRHLTRVGVEAVHERVGCLTSWLLDQLQALRHRDGVPLVEIYGPRDGTRRGGTIALNFLDPSGRIVDERVVDQRAAAAGISLRTGCFCNPGAGEAAFGVPGAVLARLFARPERFTREEMIAAAGRTSLGAVRVSLGLASTFADAYRFVRFARTFLDRAPDGHQLPPRERPC